MSRSSRETSDFETYNVGSIPFATTTLAEASGWLVYAATEMPVGGPNFPVRLSNAYCIALANRQPQYRDVLCGAGINFPDGAPIAAALRYRAASSGLQSSRRVRGPSFFTRVLDESQGTSIRHYLIGSTPETLDRLVQSIQRRFPKANLLGTYSPPFGPITDELVGTCAAQIAEVNADIVWIGMGTPKQDYLAARLAPLVRAYPVGVGAAFDFLAGVVPEAPQIVQRLGLEWLYRLSKEPRRLWRRYLIGNCHFVWDLIRFYKSDKRTHERP